MSNFGKGVGGLINGVLSPFMTMGKLAIQKTKYTITFANSKGFLWHVRDDYCKRVCFADFCQFGPRGFACRDCKMSCPMIANGTKMLALKIRHRQAVDMFKHFYFHPNMCTRMHDEVQSRCRRDHCQNGINLNCSACVLYGFRGAQFACGLHYKPRNDFLYMSQRLFPYYRRSPKGCAYCRQVNSDPCIRMCRGDLPCQMKCNEISLSMCLATCNGDRLVKLKRSIKAHIARVIKNRLERCSQCNSLCPASRIHYCFPDDGVCIKWYNKFCSHMCKFRFCRHYNFAFKKAMKIKGWQKDAHEIKIEQYSLRHNARQRWRNRYDEKKKKKLAGIVQRFNRDSIFDSLKMMEGTIYKEVRKMVDDIEEREEKREDAVMKQIMTGYTSYKNYRKMLKDEELRVFDD